MVFILRGANKHVITTSDNLYGIIETMKGLSKEVLNSKKKKINILQFEAQDFQRKISAKKLMKAWDKSVDKPTNITNI